MRDENKKGFKKKCRNSWNYSWHLKNNKDEKSPNYIKMLKRELINFPDFLYGYIMKNFMPNYKKYIKLIRNEYKEKLCGFDNELENYFGNTLNNILRKYLEQNRLYSTSYSREK